MGEVFSFYILSGAIKVSRGVEKMVLSSRE
jgi:hypothetical protein